MVLEEKTLPVQFRERDELLLLTCLAHRSIVASGSAVTGVAVDVINTETSILTWGTGTVVNLCRVGHRQGTWSLFSP